MVDKAVVVDKPRLINEYTNDLKPVKILLHMPTQPRRKRIKRANYLCNQNR